jgi:hypothetical protein
VSECLSHDHTMYNSDLVYMIHFFILEQISKDFSINKLPSETISFITLLVQRLPSKTPSSKVKPRIPSVLGINGSSSVNNSELYTPYLFSLKYQKGTKSLAPFSRPCVNESPQQDISQDSSLGCVELLWTI